MKLNVRKSYQKHITFKNRFMIDLYNCFKRKNYCTYVLEILGLREVKRDLWLTYPSDVLV